MDLTSRLRTIVKGNNPQPLRELTYEPDTGSWEAGTDVRRLGEVLGGVPFSTPFGECLVIDRRYEADRFHGDVRIGECELNACDALTLLDPSLAVRVKPGDEEEVRLKPDPTEEVRLKPDATSHNSRSWTDVVSGFSRTSLRTIFIDLETTGLSGGAGMVAFLVGCGYFDLGAFQVRQFLLTSYSAERALLAAVAEFFDGADLIVTYNGKTFDVPVMETRWMFHRLAMPLDGVPHFDMLHPARRLWRMRGEAGGDDGCCRLSTLERLLFDVVRVGDVPGLEIPGRFFRFLRSGDPRPLEPVLEHNRLDLVSLAAVTARAARLVEDGEEACRDASEAIALGKVYERAGETSRAEACYRRAAASPSADVRAEALYRIALRCRRDRRFADASTAWREILDIPEPRRGTRGRDIIVGLRRFAAEALAVHHEHRVRDLEEARELALLALDSSDERRAADIRHRLARLERKLRLRGPSLSALLD
jgi:uncharacterized protein YprB with RNaseH-like and TPR domain